MPERGSSKKVRSVYELWYIRRLAGIAETSLPPAHYDELERFSAEADYQALVRQANAEIGTEVSVETDNGARESGFVDRIVVELRSRKVGDWVSPSSIVFQEVLLDESRMSPKARAIRDGIMATPHGERGKMFGRALAAAAKDVEGVKS